jgi:hypothetical protein
MKRILLVILASVLVSLQLDAQMMYGRGRYGLDFDIAAKGGIGNAFFYNDNIHYDPDVTREILAPNYNYGGRFGVSYLNFRPKYVIFNLYGEFLLNSFQHKYDVKDYTKNDGSAYTKTLNYNTQDIAVMFRVVGYIGENNMTPRYFEVGAQFCSLQKADESDSKVYTFNYYDPSYKYTDKYNSSYTNVVVGFGIHGMFYNIGLRGTYSLTSLMKEGENVVTDDVYNGNNNLDYTNLYANPMPTRLFTIQLTLEFNLYFFEVGTASCGKFALTPFPLFLNTDYVW